LTLGSDKRGRQERVRSIFKDQGGKGSGMGYTVAEHESVLTEETWPLSSDLSRIWLSNVLDTQDIPWLQHHVD
jgi:hypothetical protein